MTAPSPAVALSIVVPLFNEAAGVDELVGRCLAAMDRLDAPAELLLVDDASSDATPLLLALQAKRDARVRPVQLLRNQGQFRATQAGLAAARGQHVVTLDGDLQDPPEVLVALVAALQQPGAKVDAVCAVKTARQDPAWFLALQWLYRTAQGVLATQTWPVGAGSYTLLSAPLAARVAALPLAHANLAAVLVGLGASLRTVPYEREARAHGNSRMGLWRLGREALGSLALTGALGRGLRLGAVGLALAGAALGLVHDRLGAVGLGLAAAALWLLAGRVTRRTAQVLGQPVAKQEKTLRLSGALLAVALLLPCWPADAVAGPLPTTAEPAVDPPRAQQAFRRHVLGPSGPVWTVAPSVAAIRGVLAGHLCLGALTLAGLALWARRARADRLLVLALLLLPAGLVAGLWLAVPPGALPVPWLSVLHEGRTQASVAHIYGHGHHGGPVLAVLGHTLGGWLEPGATPLRVVVWLNGALWLATTAAFALLARKVTGGWGRALGSTVVFSCNLAGIQAARAELPSLLLATYLLCGVGAAALLGACRTDRLLGKPEATKHARVDQVVAWGLLATATGLALATRAEVSCLGVVALGWLATQRYFPQLPIRLGHYGRRGLAWVAAAPPAWLIAVLALGVASLPLLDLTVQDPARWLLTGLHPLNPTLLSLPLALAQVMPLAAVVLAVAGLWAGLCQSAALLLVPLGAVVLYRTYFSASHGVFNELVRYLTLLLPVLGVLSWWGWPLLAKQLARWTGADPLRKRLALGAGALAWLVMLPHTVADRFVDEVRGEVFAHGNLQREVRYLVRAVERHPGCVLATRSVPMGRGADAVVLFGQPLRGHLTLPLAGSLEATVQRALPNAPCVLFYRSLDCHLLPGERCADTTRGRPVLDPERFASRSYNDPHEWGEVEPAIELGLFALRGNPAH